MERGEAIVLTPEGEQLGIVLKGDLAAMLAAASPKVRLGTASAPSWLRGGDLNPRPLGYEPNELPDCSTPRHGCDWKDSTGPMRANRSILNV